MQGTGLICALAFLIGLAQPFAAERAWADDTVQSLYAAAEREGTIRFWTAVDVRVVDKIAAQFAQRYPGIKVEALKIEPGPALQRIVIEAHAGHVNVDVVEASSAYLAPLLDRGLVASYPWHKVFGIDPGRLLFDDRAIIQINNDLPVIYNTNLVKADEIKSYDDLLNPKWRGKVIVEARGIAFAILASRWGEAKTFDYVKRLLANKPIVILGGTPVADALAGGQGAIGIGTVSARVLLDMQHGAPINWARVSPIPAEEEVFVCLKGAPHPNAAKLWNAFWTTPEAQETLWAGMHNGLLVGKDIDPHGKEMRGAGIVVVVQSPDLKRSQALLQKVGGMIGALR